MNIQVTDRFNSSLSLIKVTESSTKRKVNLNENKKSLDFYEHRTTIETTDCCRMSQGSRTTSTIIINIIITKKRRMKKIILGLCTVYGKQILARENEFEEIYFRSINILINYINLLIF